MNICSILIKIIMTLLYSQKHIKFIKNQIFPNTLKYLYLLIYLDSYIDYVIFDIKEITKKYN